MIDDADDTVLANIVLKQDRAKLVDPGTELRIGDQVAVWVFQCRALGIHLCYVLEEESKIIPIASVLHGWP